MKSNKPDTVNELQTLAYRTRQARVFRQKTLREASELTGFCQSFIHGLESYKNRHFTHKKIKDIALTFANAYNLPVDYFLAPPKDGKFINNPYLSVWEYMADIDLETALKLDQQNYEKKN